MELAGYRDLGEGDRSAMNRPKPLEFAVVVVLVLVGAAVGGLTAYAIGRRIVGDGLDAATVLTFALVVTTAYYAKQTHDTVEEMRRSRLSQAKAQADEATRWETQRADQAKAQADESARWAEQRRDQRDRDERQTLEIWTQRHDDRLAARADRKRERSEMVAEIMLHAIQDSGVRPALAQPTRYRGGAQALWPALEADPISSSTPKLKIACEPRTSSSGCFHGSGTA